MRTIFLGNLSQLSWRPTLEYEQCTRSTMSTTTVACLRRKSPKKALCSAASRESYRSCRSKAFQKYWGTYGCLRTKDSGSLWIPFQSPSLSNNLGWQQGKLPQMPFQSPSEMWAAHGCLWTKDSAAAYEFPPSLLHKAKSLVLPSLNNHHSCNRASQRPIAAASK